jgi:hypothetical protein
MITSELDAVIKTAKDYLYHYPGGVPWTKTFAAEFRGQLQQAHSWWHARSFERTPLLHLRSWPLLSETSVISTAGRKTINTSSRLKDGKISTNGLT